MAAIDKIYGTRKQYEELHDWLLINKPDALRYMYQYDSWDNPRKHRPISNFPTSIGRWLLKNCTIDWVVRVINEKYKL